MPSAMLEQEAHTLGLRERALLLSAIGSPQHLQIRQFMSVSGPGEFSDYAAPVPVPMAVPEGAERMKENTPDSPVGNNLVHKDSWEVVRKHGLASEDQNPGVLAW